MSSALINMPQDFEAIFATKQGISRNNDVFKMLVSFLRSGITEKTDAAPTG